MCALEMSTFQCIWDYYTITLLLRGCPFSATTTTWQDATDNVRLHRIGTRYNPLSEGEVSVLLSLHTCGLYAVLHFNATELATL